MFNEHAGAGSGSLQGRMATTVQEIDREAARRVAGVLAAQVPGRPETRVDAEARARDLRQADVNGPRPIHRARLIPRTIAASLLLGISAGVLLAYGISEHERFPRGSLRIAGSVLGDPNHALGDTSMKILTTPSSIAASLAAFITLPAVAQQAIQWRVEDGGNGHWYMLHPTTESWPALRMISEGLGGHLVTLNTIQEWSWIKQNFEIPFQTGRFVGGFQDRSAADFVEPGGGWRWVTGEPFMFDPAYMAPFDDFCGNQQVMYFYGCCNQFLSDIQNGIDPGCDSYFRQAIFEWSADCNNDGIVDYGQILSGQLADGDLDGVPDVCECPCDVFRDNAVNGIDLGVLLGQWGPSNQYTVTDFNADGAVDGTDLGTLLAAWGPCPG